MQGSHPAVDQNYLESLGRNFRHQLKFSEVRGVLAGDLENAIDNLYNRYVSVAHSNQEVSKPLYVTYCHLYVREISLG